MELITNLVSGNEQTLAGVAGVVCGVPLLYLVISRTIKKRRAEQ